MFGNQVNKVSVDDNVRESSYKKKSGFRDLQMFKVYLVTVIGDGKGKYTAVVSLKWQLVNLCNKRESLR